MLFYGQLLFISPAASTIFICTLLILFALSFIIAGSEVAFFSLSNKDLNILRKKKNPSLRRMVLLMDSPKTLLASMLIANSFVNIGIILISNILVDGWFPSANIHGLIYFFIKVAAVSFLIVLFAEVLPKVWATHHRIWFASTFSLVIEIINSIFSGISRKFVAYGDRIEKKVSPINNNTEEETNLDYAIDLLPENEATIEEKQILKGIRKFSGTHVKQVMRTRLDVSGIEASSTYHHVLTLSTELHYSRIPVYRTSLDDIIGVLHIKDLLPHLQESDSFNWHQLIRTPYFIHEHKMIEDLLQDFRQRRTHFAIVVDEFGGTSGIVTMEDILEEVIGDIKDEFDEDESLFKKIDENNYVFEGRIMIQDVCKVLKLPVNTFDTVRGDSDSLAGLVLEIAGAFPQINESVSYKKFIFTPLEISKNRIGKVKLVILPENPQPSNPS